MVWYLDTSAFLKLIVSEEESKAMRTWFTSHGPIWSSQLLQTEAIRASNRLGVATEIVTTVLDSISMVLPSRTTFYAASSLLAVGLRALDALHLASAIEIGDDLDGIVTYDMRMIQAAGALSIAVATPT